jgi:hypothetical protein
MTARRAFAAFMVMAICLAGCEAGIELTGPAGAAYGQAQDETATFPLRRSSGGAAGLRDAMASAFPAVSDLSKPDAAVRDAMLDAFGGTPGFDRDVALAIYAYALEEMGDTAAVPRLSAFLRDNVNGDVYWALHFAAHAVLAMKGALPVDDTGWFDHATIAAAASGQASSGLLASVSSAEAEKPSCGKRYILVDDSGKPLTYLGKDGKTHQVVVGGTQFSKPDVPASVASNYKTEVADGGGTYATDDPEFQGAPSKQFNCAGYAFRDFNGGRRWTGDPGAMYGPLVESGVLFEVPESQAQPGDKVFYFRKQMQVPGHVAEVKKVESGMLGNTVTVRNADGQSGLWDARIDAAYFTGTLLKEATYPTRKVFRWRDGKAPKAIPDPAVSANPAYCGVAAPGADQFHAEVSVDGFLISFMPTVVIAAGVENCMEGVPCRPGIEAIEMKDSENASEVLQLGLVPALVTGGGTYAFGESDAFLQDQVPAWLGFTSEDVKDKDGYGNTLSTVGGSVTFTSLSLHRGGRMAGTFQASIFTKLYDGEDEQGNSVYKDVYGTASGTFDVEVK